MRIKNILIGFCFALLGAAAAFAQPAGAPAPAPPKPFNIPEVHKFTLPNGLEVRMVHYSDVPKVTVELDTFAGNMNETANQVWLADLTGRMLEQGTPTRNAEQIALEAARMGGSLDVSVGMNETSIGGDVLSEFAPEMIGLVADVAMHPAFPEGEIARLKSDLQRELAIARSQQQSLAHEAFLKALYPEHPYGRLFPTVGMIDAYTVDQVRSFYQNNFDAKRSRIYVVGRFDDAAVEKAIRDALSGWGAGAPAKFNPPTPTSKRVVDLINRPGAVQSTLYIGLPTIDPTSPDYIPLQVTDALLGGSFGSRITSNIREAKGYTYSPRSTFGTMVGAGYWAEIADVTTAVTGPSITEIMKEIERLRGEPPTAEELRGIQNYMAGIFVLRNSSRAGIVNQLNVLDLYGLPENFLRNYVQNVYAVTPSQVQQVAKKYLDSAKMTIVVAGEKDVILEQLEPFGTVVPLQ
ncbi:MAG: pitrilysin family protein [Thermoanaerobaculia bacterium]